jgi:hypothetical protein
MQDGQRQDPPNPFIQALRQRAAQQQAPPQADPQAGDPPSPFIQALRQREPGGGRPSTREQAEQDRNYIQLTGGRDPREGSVAAREEPGPRPGFVRQTWDDLRRGGHNVVAMGQEVLGRREAAVAARERAEAIEVHPDVDADRRLKELIRQRDSRQGSQYEGAGFVPPGMEGQRRTNVMPGEREMSDYEPGGAARFVGAMATNPRQTARAAVSNAAEAAPTTAAIMGPAAVATATLGPAAGAATAFGMSSAIHTGGQLGDITEMNRDPFSGELGDKPTLGQVMWAAGSGMAAAGFETFAVDRFFRGLTRVSKGKVPPFLERQFHSEVMQRVGAIPVEAVKQGGIEFFTEYIQSVIEDVGAKFGWDPDRKVGDNAFEEAIAGFLMGLTMSGVGGSVAAARPQRQQAAQQPGQPAPQQPAAPQVEPAIVARRDDLRQQADVLREALEQETDEVRRMELSDEVDAVNTEIQQVESQMGMTEAAPQAMSPEQVEQAFDQVESAAIEASRREGLPGATVVRTASELTGRAAQAHAEGQQDSGFTPAFFMDGEVYIIADLVAQRAAQLGLTIEEATRSSYLHETVHRANRDKFTSDAERDAALAPLFGKLQDLIDASPVRQAYAKDLEAVGGIETEAGKALLVDEYFAFIGEQMDTLDAGTMRRVIDTLRTWLRETLGLTMTEADVKILIRQAAAELRASQGQGEASTASPRFLYAGTRSPGYPRAAVEGRTFKGKYDGKSRFEIDDSGATFKHAEHYGPTATFGTYMGGRSEVTLGAILDHPALFEAYPGIQTVPVRSHRDGDHLGMASNTGISIRHDLTLEEARSTLLHETQHVLQAYEGHAKGSNLERAQQAVNTAADIEDAIGTIEHSRRTGQTIEQSGRGMPEKVKALVRKYENDLEGLQRLKPTTPLEAYRRSAGEIEARDVQARRDMTAEERAKTPPMTSENIAAEDAIVRFQRVPTDRDGAPIEDLKGTPVPVNPDGTITVYHRTTAESAAAIVGAGKFDRGKENTGEVFASTLATGMAEGYGDVLLAFDVQPSDVRVDDAFDKGEVHVALNPASARNIRQEEGARFQRAPKEVAIGDQTDVSKLPKGRAIPKQASRTSLQAAFRTVAGRVFATNRELKLALQETARAQAKENKVDFNDHTQSTFAYLVDAVVADLKYALESAANAIGWYDIKVAQALSTLSLVYPEIVTDQRSRMAFLWALAVTSNGLKVDANFRLAERAYRTWQETGKMPTNVGTGTAKKAINEGLAIYNALSERFDVETLQRFMATEFTAGEVKAATGYAVSGEWVTTTVRGAALLGPKIGNGFFSNMNGFFDKLTMDRWLMRTYGRLTGTLIVINDGKIKANRDRLLEGAKALTPADRRVVKDLTGIAVAARMTVAQVDALARAINKASVDKDKRARLQATPTLDEVRLASNNLTGSLNGDKEDPSGPQERNWIRAIFAKAQERLAAEGIRMTIADMQALLWYPEKRLYEASKEKEGGTEGYADDEAPDYANAARDLAIARGVPPRKVELAQRQAALEGSQQATPFTEAEKKEFLRTTAPPPAQQHMLAAEVAPDPNNKELTAAWNELDFKDRQRITRQIAKDVINDILDALGIKSKPVGAVGGYAGLANPNILLEYKEGAVTLEDARSLAAAVGFALYQDSVALVDSRSETENPLFRIALPVNADKVAQQLMRTIIDAHPELDAFTARGKNYDVLYFGKEDVNSIAQVITDAINANPELSALGDIMVIPGMSRSELVNKEDYAGQIDAIRSRLGEEVYGRITGARDRAGQAVEQAIAERTGRRVSSRGDSAGAAGPGQSEGPSGDGPVAPRFQRAPAVNSPVFKRWFGDSKVVDESGKPRVVYHGTGNEFAVFDATNTEKGGGHAQIGGFAALGHFFTQDAELAHTFARQAAGRSGTPRVVPVYLSIQKPYRIRVTDLFEWSDRDGGVVLKTDPRDIKAITEKEGYDGIIIEPATAAVDEELGLSGEFDLPQIIAFSPDQVRIANPDIRFQRAPSPGSPEFKKWFGKSQVVDAAGKPEKVLHGTDAQFDEFRTDRPPFFYREGSEYAEEYSGMGRVVEAYVKIDNPLVSNDMEVFVEDLYSPRWIAEQKKMGHDGVISDDPTLGFVVPFDADQVRIVEKPRFQRAPAPDSPEFKKWFGKSQVVDEQGNPKKTFRGSQSAGVRGVAYFTSDPEEASSYADPRDEHLVRQTTRYNPGTHGREVVEQYDSLDSMPAGVYATETKAHGGVRIVETLDEVDAYGGRQVRWIEGAVAEPVSAAAMVAAMETGEEVRLKVRPVPNDAVKSKFDGANVMPAYLRIENPAYLSWDEGNRLSTRLDGVTEDEVQRRIEELKAKGHDGVITKSDTQSFHIADYEQAADNYIVFDADNQVRSAIAPRFQRVDEQLPGDGQAQDPGAPQPTPEGRNLMSEFPKRFEEVKKENPKESGRPELANPGGKDETTRRAVDTVDQIREDAGIPRPQTFEEWDDRARQRLADDYEGERARLLSGRANFDDPVTVRMGMMLIEREGAKVLRKGSASDLVRFGQLVYEYRTARTETARALAAGRDKALSPEERMSEFLKESILMPDEKTRKQLDKADRQSEKERAMREAAEERARRREAEAAQAEAERARQEAEEAKKATKAAERDKKAAEARTRAAQEKTAQRSEEAARLREEAEQARQDLERARRELERMKEEEARLRKEARDAKREADRLIRKAQDRRSRILQRHAQTTQEILDKLREKGVDPANLTEEQKKDPKAIADAIRVVQSERAGFGDMAYEYWLNGLLSMPTTHIVNTSTTAIWTLREFTIQRWAEVGLNAILPGDKSQSAQAGELKYVYAAINRSVLATGMRNAILAWQTETPVFSESMKDPGRQKVEKEARGAAIPGKLGRFTRWPTRLIMAVDEISKVVIWNMEVGAQAYRIAKAEGLSGAALESRIAALVADPMSVASQAAYQTALKGTFQDDPVSKFGKGLMKVRAENRPAQYMVAFARAPASLIKQATRMSPLGSLAWTWRAIRHGAYTAGMTDNPSAEWARPDFIKHTAEQILAWTGVMLVWSLLGDDDEQPRITGSGASMGQRGKRELQMRVAPPMSIRIGDTYYSYSRQQPFASMLSHTVDAVSAAKRMQKGSDFQAEFGHAFNAMVGAIRDNSFLMGVGDIIRAAEDGDNALRWASNFATSWVPNWVRGSARSSDAYLRNYSVRGDGGQWISELGKVTAQQAIPVPAFAPPPRVDWLGQELRRPQSPVPNTDWLYRMVVPSWAVRLERTTEFDRLILNWNNQNPGDEWYPTLPAPSMTIRGERVQLTKEEEYDFLKRSGELTREGLARWAESMGEMRWEQVVTNPNERHIERVQEIMRRARERARNETRRDVRQRAADAL